MIGSIVSRVRQGVTGMDEMIRKAPDGGLDERIKNADELRNNIMMMGIIDECRSLGLGTLLL